MNPKLLFAIAKASEALKELLQVAGDELDRESFALGVCRGWLFYEAPSMGYYMAEKAGHFISVSSRDELLESIRICDAVLDAPERIPGLQSDLSNF